MKILLLGATGRLGKQLLIEALKRGHSVKVIVRDPGRLPVKNPNLEVITGDVLEKSTLASSMQGCTVILSALNISRTSDWPWAPLRTAKNFLSEVMKSIIELGPKNNIQRIIFSSAWGAAETRKEIPAWFRWFIEHSNIRYPYQDHETQENLVKNSSLSWTAVRAAGLTNFKKKKTVLVSFNNIPKPKLMISRYNLATFMLDVMEQDLYINQAPVVSEK